MLKETASGRGLVASRDVAKGEAHKYFCMQLMSYHVEG